MREITLTRGMVARVDDEDFDLLASRSWCARPADQKSKKSYAQSKTYVRGGGTATIYMHRLILNAPKGVFVDHIDGDGLNNTRANLRLCTPRQNAINRFVPNSTGLRGVHRSNGNPNRFWVQLESEGAVFRLAALPNAELAARAYNALAREFHGEFAVLNLLPIKAPLIEADAASVEA